MSEYQTGDYRIPIAQWSRPSLQRTEVGPAFHEIADRVYGSIEQDLEGGGLVFPAPTKMSELSILTGYLGVEAERRVDLLRAKYADAFLDFDRFLSDQTVLGNRSMETSRHLVGDLPAVVGHDAVSSGIVVPFHVYRLMRARQAGVTERMHNVLRWVSDDPEVDGLQAATTLGSSDFLETLLTLSHAHEGSLGEPSVDYRHLIAKPTFFESFHAHIQRRLGDIFELNEAGKAVLSPDYIAQKTRDLKSANFGNPAVASGGCPVRHGTFKVVGEHAARFLKALGNEDGRPTNECQSVIAKGAGLLALALNVAKPQTGGRRPAQFDMAQTEHAGAR